MTTMIIEMSMYIFTYYGLPIVLYGWYIQNTRRIAYIAYTIGLVYWFSMFAA